MCLREQYLRFLPKSENLHFSEKKFHIVVEQNSKFQGNFTIYAQSTKNSLPFWYRFLEKKPILVRF